MSLNPADIYKSLLKEVFGDSQILRIIPEKEKLTIVIEMDLVASPGKPFGILTLKNPAGYDKLVRSQEELGIIIHEIVIPKKEFGGRFWPVVMIDTAYKAPDDYFEIPCEDFSFERAEHYKKDK